MGVGQQHCADEPRDEPDQIDEALVALPLRLSLATAGG
jgi:hypothetical protein